MTNNRLSLKYFQKYFLTVSFPTHFWTFILIFRDAEAITKRTYFIDTIGYASYSLQVAFLESLILTLIIWGLSLIIAKKLNEDTLLSILVSFYYLVAGASIIDMAAHINDQYRISQQYLHGLEKYPLITYGFIAAAILIGFTIILILIIKSTKAAKFIKDILERIILLGYLYLILDVIGIIIVILRNVS